MQGPAWSRHADAGRPLVTRSRSVYGRGDVGVNRTRAGAWRAAPDAGPAPH